jgi:thiol:disulfide interchange protein
MLGTSGGNVLAGVSIITGVKQIHRLVMGLLLVLLTTTALSAQQGHVAVRMVANTRTLQAGQQGVAAVVMEVPAGFHAQSHRPLEATYIPTHVTLKPDANITFHEAVYPDGKIEDYPKLGKLSVYSGQTIIYVPFEVKADAKSGPIALAAEVEYQVCNDSVCFPPETVEVKFETSIAPAARSVEPTEPELFRGWDPARFAAIAKPVAAPPREKVMILGRELGDKSYLFAFAAAFLIGIIFNVMPCVLPVVPLKAIGFYEVSQHNRALSLAFGAVFSLGLVLTFAVLGLLVVVMRVLNWGELFANPWFLAGIVVILGVMGLSMFGVFTVGLPVAVYRFTPRHDTYAGNFLFGILTAILSTPCTFGMFFGLLIWASGQPAAIGLSLMIVVGIGMAFPYFVLSAFPEVARRMPRTGPWAELVKQMMGFLLILSAIYFARRFIEGGLGENFFWWSLWAIVAAAGLFLIVRTVHYSHRFMPRLVAIVIALLMIVPAGAFAYRITNPPIAWKPYSGELVAEAKAKKRVVMLEFTAAWCGNCLALESTVFHDERSVKAIKEADAVAIRVDLTRKDAPGWKLLKELSPVAAIPFTAVFPANEGEPIKLTGVYSADDLGEALRRAASKKRD